MHTKFDFKREVEELTGCEVTGQILDEFPVA
jgi:hypothetical protein